jgi:hypothetical protein
MQRVPWWAAILAVAALGAGIGAAVAAGDHVQYKAEADVVVLAKAGPAIVRPLLPNLRELATSSILAGNVDSTLRLPGSPDSLRKRLHASIAPSSQVVVLTVTDRHADRARQIAQETAVVFAQLVQARFRTPPLKAAVQDPAHVVSHHGRPFLRDSLLGAAIGLVLAVAALLALRRAPVAAPTDEKLAAREKHLTERIALVTKRERELAKRAGELAKRERAADAREAEVRTAELRAEAQPPPPSPPPAPPVEAAEPELVPQAEREPPPPPVRSPGGLPTLDELERVVRERRAEFPERAEEWSDYLFFLREHAGSDGHLPSTFSGLLQDVFGDVLH